MNHYFLPEGYIENADPTPFVDVPTETVWQPDVYPHALRVAREYSDVTTVLDLGCGNGDKLTQLAHMTKGDPGGGLHYIGVDCAENIHLAFQRRSARGDLYIRLSWQREDIERRLPQMDSWSKTVVIMADVIEHLRYPSLVLRMLVGEGPAAVVLSTPDRELTWGTAHRGPPPNRSHVREWARDEFEKFVKSRMPGYALTVEHTRSNDRSPDRHTILVTARRSR